MSNPLCTVHIRRQRQAIARKKQKVHDTPQKDGRRWTGHKMKSATEFGAHAENYSRTRHGPNSNNVFFALLVPTVFSAFPSIAAFTVFFKKRERKKERKFHISSIYSCAQYYDSSAKIELIRGTAKFRLNQEIRYIIST